MKRPIAQKYVLWRHCGGCADNDTMSRFRPYSLFRYTVSVQWRLETFHYTLHRIHYITSKLLHWL